MDTALRPLCAAHCFSPQASLPGPLDFLATQQPKGSSLALPGTARFQSEALASIHCGCSLPVPYKVEQMVTGFSDVCFLPLFNTFFYAYEWLYNLLQANKMWKEI